MNKKNLILIILLIIILVGMGTFYFYLKNFKVSNDLTHYMPRETELYIEYNLTDKGLENFKANNFRGKVRWEKLISDSDFFGDLSKGLIQESNRIVLLIINYQDEQHKAWLVNADNIHKFHALLPKGYYESILDSKTIVLSKNREVLKLIQEVGALTEHSSNQRDILNKFSDDNFMNIYMSGSHAESLSTRSDPTYSLVLNNLDLDYNQPSFLGLSTNESKIIYNFYGTTNESKNYSTFKDVETRHRLVSDNVFLQYHVANTKDVYNEIISAWPKNKPASPVGRQQEWSEKYEFEFKDIEKILDSPGVIFLANKSGQIDIDEILNFEKYNYALQVQTKIDQNKINEIKQVVKNILAFKYPSESIKKLPDGTESTELVADPERFNFSRRDEALPRLIEFIQEGTFKFVIASGKDYLIIGNSLNLIEDILSSESTEIACKTFTGNELAIINSNQLVQGLLSYADKAIINIEYNKKEIELKGCLLW